MSQQLGCCFAISIKHVGGSVKLTDPAGAIEPGHPPNKNENTKRRTTIPPDERLATGLHLWTTHFPGLDKLIARKQKHWTFNCTAKTDGISISFTFARKTEDNTGIPKHSKSKSKQNNTSVACSSSTVDSNGPVHKPEDWYCVGIDPGLADVWTAHDSDGATKSMSNRKYRLLTHEVKQAVKRNHCKEKFDRDHANTLDAESKIPTARVVTSDELQPRLLHMAQWAHIFHDMYAHKVFRLAKLDVYIAKQRVHSSLEHTLKKGTLITHGLLTKKKKRRAVKRKQASKTRRGLTRKIRIGLGDGDWNRGLRPKGHASVPARAGLWQKMSERTPKIFKMINEYRTSKRCSANHTPHDEFLTKVPLELRNWPVSQTFERQWRLKHPDREATETDVDVLAQQKEEMFQAYQTHLFRHRWLYCTACRRILNRDVNAAKNILDLTTMWPLRRPDLTRRSNGSTTLRMDS